MTKLKVINPKTEKILTELSISTRKDIYSKIGLAKKKQEEWSTFPYKKRASILKKFNKLVKKNKRTIAIIMSSEMGKPLDEAQAEINRAIENTNWFINNVEKELKPKKIQKDVLLTREPIGVVAAITPWNLPFLIPLWIIPPALLTGNTVVFKPSEISPLTGLKIMDFFTKASLPKGCLNIIIGGDKVGKEVVKSNVDMIAFVGSQKAGKDIMKNSSSKLHRLVFELGGKDPLIVCKDANLKQAAKDTVKGALLNCGQLCASVERVYVDKSIYSAFIDMVVKEVKTYPKIGPLSNPVQLKMVQSHINDAKKRGAKILVGGKKIKGKGYFFEPTVIVDVDHTMKLMIEETFGPIIPIMEVDSIKQAIKLSNSSSYGLCASIYLRNKTRAKEIAGKLKAGTVCINSTPKSHAAFPWGGMKQSGFGRMLSQEGINEFLEIKVIHLT